MDGAIQGTRDLTDQFAAAGEPCGAEPRALLRREALLSLMRSAAVADGVARDAQWRDALRLMTGAAEEILSPMKLEPSVAVDAQYQQARESLAQQVRELLGATLQRPIVRLRSLGRRLLTGLLAIVSFVLASAVARHWRERELTVGASWQASSAPNGQARGEIKEHQIYESLPAYFFHTESQTDPHLDVDLHTSHTLERIVVVNRHDGCIERARGLTILVSRDGTTFDTVAARDPQSFFRRWEVSLPSTPARHVRFQLTGESRILHLADVRIYGR